MPDPPSRRAPTDGPDGHAPRSSASAPPRGSAPDNGPADPAFYRQLWRHTLLRLVLTYVAPMVLLAVFFNLQYHRLADESRRRHAVALAEAGADTLDLFLRERIANLVNVIDDPRLPLPPPDEQLRQTLAKLRRDSDAFADVGYFGPDGRLASYAGPYPSLVGREYRDQEWYVRLLTGDTRHVITDMYLGFRQRQHFTIAVVRHTGDGAVVLRATLDPERMFTVVTRRDDPGHRMLLVNVAGAYQMVDPPAIADRRPGGIVPPAEPPLGSASAAADGHDVEYAYCWLDVADWAVIVLAGDGGGAVVSPAGAQTSVAALSLAAVLAVLSTVVIRARSVVRARRRDDRAKAALSDQLLHAARLASVGELAAGVAHEINNPLAIVAEEAGLLRDLLDPAFAETADREELVEHLDAIHEATFRARDITRKLLSFVRKGTVVPACHDLESLLEDIVGGFLERELSASDIRFVRRYAGDLPPVMVDRGQLEQVIVNLVTNAVDAIAGAGEITVATGHDGRGVWVAVGDTGCGISREHLERIFMPFFTTKEVGKGTGLGLSVSYGLIRGMGGDILVESTAGVGSTFTLVLPPAPPADAPSVT